MLDSCGVRLATMANTCSRKVAVIQDQMMNRLSVNTPHVGRLLTWLVVLLLPPIGPAMVLKTGCAQEPTVPSDAETKTDASTEAPNSATVNLAIETIRELDPQTPIELLRAVETLLNIQRPDVAMQYLQKLIDQSPDDATLTRVTREIGPAFFIRLTREPGMGEAASVFARRVLEVTRSAVTDPRRIRRLIEQLQSTNPELRAMAVAGIIEAGSAAVGELLLILDAKRGSDEYRHLQFAMRALGRDAHGPLLGALHAPDDRIQAAAIRSLADLGVQTAIPFLCRPALLGNSPDVQVAAQAALAQLGGQPAGSERSNAYLAKVARRLLRSGFPDGRKRSIKVWSWDTKNRSPVSKEMAPKTAAAFFAAWLAMDLHQLEPNDREFQQLFITAQLAAAKRTGGLDVSIRKSQPAVFARLAQLPVPQFDAVLKSEVRRDETAAMGAAEMLGHLGSEATLAGDGDRSPLAEALLHGDPRVRFAAVEAIVRIDPLGPYAGAADFWRELGRFARTTGARRVLVVHSHSTEADNLAGMANGQGFTAAAVATHQAAMKLATASPDIEAILVSDTVELWTELLQQIRRDPRTSRIPVGFIARSQSLLRAEQLARSDRLTVAYPLPYDPETLAIVLQNTLNQESMSKIDAETRMAQGQQAIGWLADIVSNHGSYSFYDILDQEPTLIEALAVPEFAAQAVAALGALGTPTAQRTLVDLAGQTARPVELRQAATKAFHAATRRQGVQLTTKQVLAQYDRYNASETLDEATQQILGSILDSIETATERTSVFETIDTP